MYAVSITHTCVHVCEECVCGCGCVCVKGVILRPWEGTLFSHNYYTMHVDITSTKVVPTKLYLYNYIVCTINHLYIRRIVSGSYHRGRS